MGLFKKVTTILALTCYTVLLSSMAKNCLARYSSDLADVYAEHRGDLEHCSQQVYARDLCNVEANVNFQDGKEEAASEYTRCIL
ncbi:MAG: hypothetical protein ACJA0J_001558 [Bdellovibrionota bacterium]|jgi:hypothetical protein